jgi:hypothetical protein
MFQLGERIQSMNPNLNVYGDSIWFFSVLE